MHKPLDCALNNQFPFFICLYHSTFLLSDFFISTVKNTTIIVKIFSDYFEALEKDQATKTTVEECLAAFVEIRHRYFQKYYMLHLSGGSPDASLNSDSLRASFLEMKAKNEDFHAKVLQRAIDNGEIAPVDPYKIAELYLDSQAGITSLCLLHGNKELFPSKKEMKSILEKQHQLSKIFIKGLK